MSTLPVVVVGAGINGLCTAWHLLRRLPGASVAVVDAHPDGHGRGSSHGEERIIRSSYATPEEVRAMVRAQGELWPALESDLGERLIAPGPAVFWGPEAGPLPVYAAAVGAGGAQVEEVDVAEARRRFPHMRFPDGERVLHDHTAGVIAAGRTMRALQRRLAAAGVHRVGARVVAIEEDAGGVTLVGTGLRAERVVVAAGPWTRHLLPAVADRARPARQHVGFWEMDAAPGRTPAWVHLGVDGLHYGLPTFDGRMKAAFHGTGTGDDDPDRPIAPDADELARVEERLCEWFDPGPGARVGADTCFYTNAPDDVLHVGPAPGHTRVCVLAACSGHAFKLAPLTGETAAKWATGG